MNNPEPAYESRAAIPYRPSSGSEGADFMEQWCCRCEADVNGDCPIAADTMIYRISDPQYPSEWREDGPLGPRCTAFVTRLTPGRGEAA